MKRIFTFIGTTAVVFFMFTGLSPANSAPGNTIRGLDLSVKGGYFQYREPDADISFSGLVTGIQGAYKKDIAALSIKIRSEIMAGQLDYDGHLNVHQTQNATVNAAAVENNPIRYGSRLWYSDSSVLFGKSFQKQRYLITPYAGLGYRYLNNPENAKVQSDYQREVTYIYLPLVLEFQKQISNTRGWGIIGEVDILLKGSAKADLSDASETYNDLTFNQSMGGAIKVSGFYNRKVLGFDLSIKPFLDVWVVDASDTDVLKHEGERVMVRSADGNLGDYCEPANITITGGLQLALNF